jgi:putative ABC transport system substrate-binding protein
MRFLANENFPGAAVSVLGLAALLLAPEHSAAQQTQSKIPRVGMLSVADSERAVQFDAFRQGLRDLGYVEGRNIVLEFRLARGNLSLGPQLAAELVSSSWKASHPTP